MRFPGTLGVHEAGFNDASKGNVERLGVALEENDARLSLGEHAVRVAHADASARAGLEFHNSLGEGAR